jgi:hypothetical protein
MQFGGHAWTLEFRLCVSTSSPLFFPAKLLRSCATAIAGADV